MKIIIANTNVQALLKTTDSILSAHGRGDIPEHIKGQTVLTAIKKMQNNGYFDICAINELCKLNDVQMSDEHKNFMYSLHCAHWEEMHQDTKEYLMALVVNYFRGNISMAYAGGTVK